MIFFLSGDNLRKLNENYNFIKAKLLEKEKFLNFEKIENQNFTPQKIAELLNQTGLFCSKSAFCFKNSFQEIKNFEKFFLDNLEKFQNSQNIFILIEEERKDFEKIKPFCSLYKSFLLQEEPKENIFKLNDLLLEKNKINLWLEYDNLRQKGFSAENILSTLIWGIKQAYIIKNKINYPIKPFVKNKIERKIKNLTPQEINKMYFRLLDIQNSSYEKSLTINLEIEKFILKLNY